jgi:hypothetical protein
MLILKRAKEYGFIDDTVFQKLEHIYDLRCLYGHPYETAPTDLELLSASEVIVNEVLSKPTVLKAGYVNRLINQLFDDVNFLENSRESVGSFAKDIADKIAPSVYPYLLEKYSEKIETAFSDASLRDVVRRGIWFLNNFILKVGTGFYTATQWHDYCSRFPNTAQAILLSHPDIFTTIGVRARDYIISFLLSESSQKPSYLKKIEKVYENNLLSPVQERKFRSVDITAASLAKLKITSCFDIVIDAFKSYNWYKQNPAAILVKSNDRQTLHALSADNQTLLGRNILQAADGSSGEAAMLLVNYVQDETDLPQAFIKGIIFECFLNESNLFRLKLVHIDKALDLLKTRPDLISELCDLLDASQPKTVVQSTDFDSILASVATKDELSQLHHRLVANRERLVVVPDF